jgi:hypothetical protein
VGPTSLNLYRNLSSDIFFKCDKDIGRETIKFEKMSGIIKLYLNVRKALAVPVFFMDRKKSSIKGIR